MILLPFRTGKLIFDKYFCFVIRALNQCFETAVRMRFAKLEVVQRACFTYDLALMSTILLRGGGYR